MTFISRSTRSINALRADRLVRGLREDLAARSANDSGQAPARQYGYGLAKVETTRVFRQITSDGRLHVVDIIAGDEIDGVFAYIVDGSFVFPGDFPGQLRDDGTIFSGEFSGTGSDGSGTPIGSKIRLSTGAAGQVADSELVSRTTVDNTFVGTGLAYVYSIWTFIEGKFEGDPEIGVIARLRKPVDPRGSATRWSFNPYVQLYDILTKGLNIGGAGIDAALIDTASFSAGANWADMLLDSPGITKTALFTTETNTPSANHVLEFNDSVVPFQYGDVVQVVAAAGQSLPPNYSPGVDYHVIPVRHAINIFQLPGIALAATLQDALDGNFITAGTRSTDIDIVKVRETRYMSGLSYTANESPLSVVQRMLESCGASLYLADGKIAVTRQTFPATIQTVTEDDLLGEIDISNKLPADERATSLTGVFTSLLNLLEQADYPTQDGGGIYQTLDAGRSRPLRLELPFVGKANAAQRLASIALRRLRQEKTIAFNGSLALYRLQPGTVFSVDKPSLGLDSNTTFEVREHTLSVDISDDEPFIGVDIVGRQLESDTFDLSVGDEAVVEAARIPGLDSPFSVAKPGEPEIVEGLFVTTTGAGVKARATISWTASTGGFISGYQVSFKLTSETVYRRLATTPDTSVQIDDIAPGTYDFQVVAVNSVGLQSDPSVKQQQILALSAPPADPTGFEGQAQNQTVILQWDLTTDLDVRFGGQVEIRHQSDTAGGKGGDSRQITTVDGNLTTVQVPFVLGTYYIRFIDQQGNSSGFDEWSTDGVRPVPFGQTITSGAFNSNDGVTENQVTLAESPTFPSTNAGNTLIEDTVNQWLELPLEGGIDAVADIDAVANIDDIPAGDSVASEGVWFFDQDIELTAAARVRWEAEIETEVVDIASGIDSIANIDDVPNIDAVGAGTAQVGQATAWIEVRYSRGTVASDTFGPWERLESRVLFHRSFQFRIQARSFLPTVNIRIRTAALHAREVPFDA